MTDLPPADPLPDADRDPASSLTVPPAPRRLDPVPLLFTFGVLVLAGASAFLYTHPYHRDRGGPAAPRLDALEQRISALEHRTMPTASPDLRAMQQRIAALEARPATGAAPESPDTDVQALTDKVQALQTDVTARLAELDKQVAAAHQAAESLQTTAAWQRAAADLAAGRPLGVVPGAPPALQRFVEDAPPTEAGLRLQYPDAAAAARRVSRPDMANKPVLRRMWAEMQRAITIRQGDKVVVGDPASGILSAAAAQLDAGDLTGAVQTLHKLDATAAAAMAPWMARAQALLDARAALADHTG